jgi:Protein of unknown function, DUF481
LSICRFICISIFLGLCQFGVSQKTDKVKLKNGDIITGEIMSMKLGKLTYKTDGAGTVSIKWEEVTGMTSNKVFEFTLRDGTLSVSTLDTLFQKYHLKSLDDITEIIPIKDRFLKRLSGDVNLGFNYAKSNSILQSNFSGGIAYRIPKVELSLKINSVLTNYGQDTSLSKKQDIVFNAMKNLKKNNFFWGSSLGWQENTELGVASRYLVSAVLGLEPLTDNHNRLLISSGFSYNQEQSVETSQYTGYLDALFSINYKRFYYSTPKLYIDATYILYPGISDWGRIRMQADLNVSVEIISDFTMGLNAYYSYDNKPPEGSVSTSDYGIMFTIGYSFGK